MSDEKADKPEAKYTLVCDASGVHQEFETEADSKADAEEKLRRRASQAGWSQSDCKMA